MNRFLDIKESSLTSRNEMINYIFRGVVKAAKNVDNVNQTMKLAVSLAKRYQNLGVPYEDLCQCAFIGLLKADKLFDESKGIAFSTFAVIYIREALYNEVADNGRLVRLPRNHNKEKMFTLSGDATLSEDSESVDTFFTMLSGDMIANEYDKTQTLTEKVLQKLSKLEPKERDIIIRHYGIGVRSESLTEIAYKEGVTSERIRQIVKAAITKMKKRY